MPERNIYLEDIPLHEAHVQLQNALEIAGCSKALSGETIALTDALNRVTAEAIRARLSSPHYHCAAMDGYAVRSENTLGATETQPLSLTLQESAFPVNTGDSLPDETNAVIMIEHVNAIDDQKIQIYATVAPWQHVRLMGEDMVASETIVQVNHQIRPVDLGAIAGCGYSHVTVRRKPLVTIIPTGSELVTVSQTPQPGQLIEYNSLILAGQITDAGGYANVIDIVPDDHNKLLKVMQQTVNEKPDLILVLSGSSAGSRDYTAHIIHELGQVLVHGIAVRPGHPVIIGMVNDIPVIGVPGYPVSATLTGEIFVVPLIYQWLGLIRQKPQVIEAVSTRKIVSPTGDDDYVRVSLASIDDHILATPLQRGAGVITSLVEADGLAHLPRFQEGVDKGQLLNVSLYRPIDTILQTIMVMGSHDPMLDMLETFLRLNSPQHRVVSVNVGSIGGLVALKRGEAHLAGIHLFDPKTETYNIPYIKKYLGDEPVRLITFAHREQGLIVPAGNPHGISRFEDIRSLRYVNRQRGAGTRVLFDYLLDQYQLLAETIIGYDHEEYTHLAVAAAVADGIGDCGLGVYNVAHSMGLDFISITQERFDLVIPHRFLEDDGVQALLELLANESFKSELGQQPGYNSKQTGHVWIE
jgi:putative molybdopterin biosynthesis protein